jgi:hypothetical protein
MDQIKVAYVEFVRLFREYKHAENIAVDFGEAKQTPPFRASVRFVPLGEREQRKSEIVFSTRAEFVKQLSNEVTASRLSDGAKLRAQTALVSVLYEVHEGRLREPKPRPGIYKYNNEPKREPDECAIM